MRPLWDETAREDYLYWQTQDKKTMKRINALIKDKKSRNSVEMNDRPFHPVVEKKSIIL